MNRPFLAAIGVFGLSGLCATAWAQTTVVNEVVKVDATAPVDNDCFGVSIDADASYLLVGSPGLRSSGFAGNVYLYRRNPDGSLTLEKEIPGPTDSLDTRFGVSVALGNDFFAVGSSNHYHEDDNPRAVVHIYERNHPTPDAWGLRSVVEMPDETLSLASGNLIALARSGNTIVAGFPSMERVAFIRRNGGSGSNWMVTSTVEDPNPANFDNFGYAVDVEGNRMVVGSRFDDEFGSSEGAVYFYEFNGSNWVERQKIAPPEIINQAYFGDSVDMSGDWLAVHDVSRNVTLFRLENGQWNFSQKITFPSGGVDSISLWGNQLLIGETGYNEGTLIDSGQAILYLLSAENVWEPSAFLRPGAPVNRQNFGGGVLIGDGEYFVGSGWRNTSTNGTLAPGCASIFARLGDSETYEDWTLRMFSTAQRGQNLHAPDVISNRFRIANLMAYAMGLDPFDPDPSSVPRIAAAPDGTLNYFFQRSPEAIDAEVRLLSSTNLVDWELSTVSPALTYVDGTYRYSFPLVDAADNEVFFKFEITGPPE